VKVVLMRLTVSDIVAQWVAGVVALVIMAGAILAAPTRVRIRW
jgi:hypothetical protein